MIKLNFGICYLCLILIYGYSFSVSASDKTVFVTSANAKIKLEANTGSADVISVARGDELTVISESGNWIQIKKGETTGWITKLFVGKQKPIGKNEILKESKVSEEKLARKRTSDYSVSAATRGLSAGERNSRGEKFRSNDKALETLEKNQPKENEVEKFDDNSKPKD